MNYWLITDTHFGHNKMPLYCGRPIGYEEIILKSLGQIPEGDILIHLGDICFGKDDMWHEKFFASTSARKWLIRGNHDHKSNAWYLSHGWDMVCDKLQFEYMGKNLLFTHEPQPFPFESDPQPYDFNIHGHLHNMKHHENEITRHNKLLLMAVEYTNYQPITLENFIKRGGTYAEN